MPKSLPYSEGATQAWEVLGHPGLSFEHLEAWPVSVVVRKGVAIIAEAGWGDAYNAF